MSDAAALNADLERLAPGFARCLSPLGRRAVFPKGIPFQAAAARGTTLNATIGQVTDGAGQPMPLPSLEAALGDLDRRTCLLYSPQPGHADLRATWRTWQLGWAGRTEGPITLPFATHGLTHGLGLVADLFADPDTTVILPKPSWGNYKLLFTMRSGARLAFYDFFDDAGGFNLDGLAEQLEAAPGKVIVILNFPSNPTGYSPTPDEADALVARLAAHEGPAVFVADDAYQGVVHEPGLLDHSIYWRMAEAADPEHHAVIKIDGATKELFFFPSRIGFFSAALPSEAEPALFSKLNCLVRGSVGSPPGPSQALMRTLLADPDKARSEFSARKEALSERYRALRDALEAVDNPRIVKQPFNAAYFALIGIDPSLDVHRIREQLIAERSVGVIAIPDVSALRIAYCSARAEDLPAIVQHVDEVVAAQ